MDVRPHPFTGRTDPGGKARHDWLGSYQLREVAPARSRESQSRHVDTGKQFACRSAASGRRCPQNGAVEIRWLVAFGHWQGVENLIATSGLGSRWSSNRVSIGLELEEHVFSASPSSTDSSVRLHP